MTHGAALTTVASMSWVEERVNEDCEEGFRHRASQVACVNQERSAQVATGVCDIEGDCCASDDDCGEDSACWESGLDSTGDAYGLCFSRCETDNDCQDGYICECGSDAGRCVPSTCGTDSDCADGRLCVASVRDEGCGQKVEYTCQTPSDECVSDKDCAGSEPDFETCATNGTRRMCLEQYQSCD